MLGDLLLLTMKYFLAAFLGAVAPTWAQVATTTEPSLSEISASQATVEPYSPVSNVTGLAFDRIFQVWFENIVSVTS